MFQFFSSKNDQRIRNRIELVSVHIPKTAGTSFRNTLKAVYGEDLVVRLDIDLQQEQLRINEQPFTAAKLDKKIKVVHGHFSPQLLHQRFKIAPKTPVITWLRDPVERVISNYFYLEKRLKEELQEEAKGLNILSKMQRSLIEYAQGEINRNRMSKFLAGIELEALFFVGIQEHYSTDLKALADLLQWPQVIEHQHNITGRSNKNVSPEEQEAIAQLNQKDVLLYQKALQLRAQRTHST
ncbi:MAG: sulfotransferase family 2 domain-containing protein [Bacteroidota bacterium]